MTNKTHLDPALADTAPELLEAAQLVIARWSSGDLAEAVRQLDYAVGKATRNKQ